MSITQAQMQANWDEVNSFQQGKPLIYQEFPVTPEPTPEPEAAPVYVDPYAKYGGTAAFNNLVSGFNNQLGGIKNTSLSAAQGKQGAYSDSIHDTVLGYTRNQQDINAQRVQNEASKIQGGRDIMDMVGRGIKSGGTMLGNRNAGSSSAAQAIANAYSKLGQRQMSSVGNQYSKNQGAIDTTQNRLSEDIAYAPTKFHTGLMETINGIVDSATSQLYALDAQMAQADMPTRIAIAQEQASIRDSVLGALQQYDAQFSQGVGAIHAADRGTNIGVANTQLAAGKADPNLFNYTTQAPMTMQNTGPVASELPLYTYNSKYKQTA